MDIQVQQEVERIILYKKCDEHVELDVIGLGLFWRNPELSVFDNLIHRTMSIVEIYSMDIMANNVTKCGKFLIFSLHCKIWDWAQVFPSDPFLHLFQSKVTFFF